MDAKRPRHEGKGGEGFAIKKSFWRTLMQTLDLVSTVSQTGNLPQSSNLNHS